MPTWFAVSFSCLLIYLAFVVWAQVRFGSYRYALSYLKGSRLQVSPAFVTIGAHGAGETYQTSVTLRNHGNSPADVVGAFADCSCIANRDLPKTVPPGGSIPLPITIRFGKRLGDWHQSISFLTDDPRESALRVDLAARVVASSKIPSKTGVRR